MDKLHFECFIDFINLADDQTKILYLKNPPLQILYSLNESLFSNIKKPSEKVQLEAVKLSELNIKYIKNPSEEVQLVAVKKNGYIINYIKNPSEKVQLASVEQNSDYIHNIKNPCEEAQLEAIKQNSDYIEYIKNPSEKVQLASVEQNGLSIEYIKNPSENVQLAAISNGIKFNLFNDYDYLKRFLQQINHTTCLLTLYNHVDIDYKHIIKKSPYWKDDANLILEVING